jgi:hypothetical protein
MTAQDTLLRLALRLDGVVSGAMGVAFVALSPLLDGRLGVPAAFLLPLGAFLVVYGGLVYRLAASETVPREGVLAVIAANLAWVAVSLGFLALDAFSPTTAGQVITAVQAAGVAGFAALQTAGLRRQAAAAPARWAG